MVLYFSATGNTEFIAKELAAQIKNGERMKPFYSTDVCIGCGKCARLCPLNNISIVDKRPVWNDSCAHCMACMSNCPVEAIEYGKITQGQYKYRLDKYWKE
ncbi:MAG: EFR1 family ferrodoxin [Lachnospiraceae bacterium]|nr:EFR1 family ferrodoxin [Lachnospiraceae bacterium]